MSVKKSNLLDDAKQGVNLIVDTPTIQYVVEEAVEAGLTDILMIIGKGKLAIEEHFDRSYELENQLQEKKKFEELESIRAITKMVNIHFVWQKELNGLGDAVRYARHHVGNEPFAMLLGDTLLESQEKSVTQSLVDVYEQHKGSAVALEEVDPQLVSRYGVMSGKEMKNRIYKVDDFIEKPEVGEAPSNLVIAIRYVFHPAIFDYLDKVMPGKNDEIQLTDAMRMMVKDQPMFGYRFDGIRHDIGNKLDFIKTNVHYGLQRDDIGPALKEWIKELAGRV